MSLPGLLPGVVLVAVQSVGSEVAQELVKHQLYSETDKLILNLIAAALIPLGAMVARKLWPVVRPMAEFFSRDEPILIKFPTPVLTPYEEHMRLERLKASQGEIPGWKAPRYLC